MNSILAISPGNTRVFDMEIASALGDINAAVIVQQLHYWMQKESVGTLVEGVKYVYNTFEKWVTEQFQWLSVWQFRKSMSLLRSHSIVKVIRYKARQWNQTNYYSLDYDRLMEFLKPKMAETIEKSDLCVTTDRDVNCQQIEVRDSNISSIEAKSTFQKKAAKADESGKSKSTNTDSERIAAAPSKKTLKTEQPQKQVRHHQTESNPLARQNQAKSDHKQQVTSKENKFGACSINEVKKIPRGNRQWRSLVAELDSIGVPINKTLISLVKIYEEEQVREAIALLKIRKREKHIPNPGGYFTAALKGNWATSNPVTQENSEEILKDTAMGHESFRASHIDTASVFRLWYDLAKELGYCSSQEVREGEQWVCLSGSWERWSSAIARGYSLEYLKKVMKRN